MRLTDIFSDDLARVRRSPDYRDLVLVWAEAVVLTMREKGVEPRYLRIVPEEPSEDDDRVIRWLPFWRARSVDDLLDIEFRLSRFRSVFS